MRIDLKIQKVIGFAEQRDSEYADQGPESDPRQELQICDELPREDPNPKIVYYGIRRPNSVHFYNLTRSHSCRDKQLESKPKHLPIDQLEQRKL